MNNVDSFKWTVNMLKTFYAKDSKVKDGYREDIFAACKKSMTPANYKKWKGLIEKREKYEKLSREASAKGDKEKQQYYIDLMWKANNELRWIGPEVVDPSPDPNEIVFRRR